MMSEQHKNRVIGQATSARWWLTIMAGVCLLMLVGTYCRLELMPGTPPPSFSLEGILAILTMVFMSYFQRSRDGEDNGNGHDKGEEKKDDQGTKVPEPGVPPGR